MRLGSTRLCGAKKGAKPSENFGSPSDIVIPHRAERKDGCCAIPVPTWDHGAVKHLCMQPSFSLQAKRREQMNFLGTDN